VLPSSGIVSLASEHEMNKISRRSFVRLAGTGIASSTLVSQAHATNPLQGTIEQSCANTANAVQPFASSFRIAPPEGSRAAIFLSPEALSMSRPRISLQGRALRLFNVRGSVSFRTGTVTGLKAMLYPPFNPSESPLPPPLGLSEGGFFGLAFREEQTGTLIQDIQDEFDDPLYLNQKASSANRLGPVYNANESSSILLSQDAHWWPHCYVRTGVFNRKMAGKLIAFRVECRVFQSAFEDQIYEELELINSTDELLSVTIIPDQPRTNSPQSSEREPVFVSIEGDFVMEVVSDLGHASADGWHLEIPPKGARTARFALLLKHRAEPSMPGFHIADLASRIQKSNAANIEQLEWASSQLPQVQTANPMFDEFYKRSILSVLLCRRMRSNFCVEPFYDLGYCRGAAVAWDTSFSSRLLAQLDPQGLLGMVTAFLRSGGALNSTYLEWNGNSRGWYAQSPFALMDMVCDYIRLTGDSGALDKLAGESSILDYLIQAGKEFITHYTGSNSLIDIGEGTGKMLEIRTGGYDHQVATINALAVDYFHQLSEWCAIRSNRNADIFQKAAVKIEGALNSLLWDQKNSWYGNMYPDGTLQMVYSYHVYDMLRTKAVSLERKSRMAERIREGEFLAPYGMYSISLSDNNHWDMEDCDWGGGGQYVGQTLRIAESLYSCGEADRAWELLSRCTRWVERFPYFPQTIYGDELALQSHQIDWPLQISAGAGAQAIIGGIFGMKPQLDGSLIIEPNYNKTLGSAKLTGYRFREHVYDVSLTSLGFEVFKDGHSIGKKRNGETVTIPCCQESATITR